MDGLLRTTNLTLLHLEILSRQSGKIERPQVRAAVFADPAKGRLCSLRTLFSEETVI